MCQQEFIIPVCNYLTKNTPDLKKEQPRTKTGLAEKDVKSNGRPMPPGFDRFESFGHDDLTTKHCYLMLMGSNILIPSTSGGLEHLK